MMMRNATILIGGQLLSFISTTLTGMAVGIWIFRETGSVVDFAALAALTLLPAIVISPFAGVIADRLPRKPMMLLVDAMSAVASLAMMALLLFGKLEIWHLYINGLVCGVSLGMQRPLYESVTPLMVPGPRLAFFNGIVQSIAGLGQVAAPALAGLMVSFGLKWVLIIDLVTFMIALVCILSVKVPNGPVSTAPTESWPDALSAGWRFVARQPGLMALLALVSTRNFLFAACEAIIVPLLLTLTTAQNAGMVLSAGGLGMIAGGLLIGVLSRGRRLIVWVILAQGLTAVAMIIGGFVTSLPLIAFGLALAFLAFPIEEATSTTIFQRKVPSHLLGRVASLRNLMAMSAPPLGMLIAAPLADKVLEPLMRGDGSWSGTLGPWFGVGEGRGMAVLLFLTGVVTLVVTILASRYRPLMNVEVDVPDQDHVADSSAPLVPVAATDGKG